eukprot:TRINITY_DN1413_c0_g1_i3.p1 TRINITY_DN1413_c0_g1~~TRINITY_DN1413_c0_g1_i3.p1  ORF type:complete len:101 (+),score=10.85 TRINITY_DN1413_c0_g1_i3:295-597(+)
MIQSAWDQCSDYITFNPNAANSDITRAYFRGATLAFMGSLLFNVLLYIPTYLVNLIGYSHDWKPESISSANNIVVILCGAVPAYIIFKYRQHKQKQINES